MPVKLEIITTGNEIMSGLTLDSNFNWLAKIMISTGINPISSGNSNGISTDDKPICNEDLMQNTDLR